jgi:hypothetical protein
VIQACQKFGFALKPATSPRVLGLELNTQGYFAFEYRVSDDEQGSFLRHGNQALNFEQIPKLILDLLKDIRSVNG